MTNALKHKTWVVGTVVLLSLTLEVSTAEACSCGVSTVQSSYYNADDVFIGRVAFSAQVGNVKWYVVRAGFTLKGCLKPGQWVYLKTAATSVACGLQLAVGQTYYLNASQQSSAWSVPVLSVNSCAYNKTVSALTPEEREWLLGRSNCCGESCACVDGTPPVSCFANPCDLMECPAGNCVANYCGGCHAEFFNSAGQLMCTPCENDNDCPGSQHCSVENMCLWGCQDSSDCNPGYWCSPTQNAGMKECRAYQTEGEACGGVMPAWATLKCLPELVCADIPSFLPSQGGVCRKPCDSNADCASGQYCGSGQVCREDGSCQQFSDCSLEGNIYMTPFCIGYPQCAEQQCSWICGNPQCPDVEDVDFGPCDAELGWANVDGDCNLVSGCDAQGYSFFASEAACAWTCGGSEDPMCSDYQGVDFGLCKMTLGFGVVNGACASISGCSSGDYTLFDTLEGCVATCGTSCEDLSGVDFGDCEQALGVGYVDGSCQFLSGCSDQGYALYETMGACKAACSLLDKEAPALPNE